MKNDNDLVEAKVFLGREQVKELVSKVRTETGLLNYDCSDNDIIQAFVTDVMEKYSSSNFADIVSIVQTICSKISRDREIEYKMSGFDDTYKQA